MFYKFQLSVPPMTTCPFKYFRPFTCKWMLPNSQLFHDETPSGCYWFLFFFWLVRSNFQKEIAEAADMQNKPPRKWIKTTLLRSFDHGRRSFSSFHVISEVHNIWKQFQCYTVTVGISSFPKHVSINWTLTKYRKHFFKQFLFTSN